MYIFLSLLLILSIICTYYILKTNNITKKGIAGFEILWLITLTFGIYFTMEKLKETELISSLYYFEDSLSADYQRIRKDLNKTTKCISSLGTIDENQKQEWLVSKETLLKKIAHSEYVSFNMQESIASIEYQKIAIKQDLLLEIGQHCKHNLKENINRLNERSKEYVDEKFDLYLLQNPIDFKSPKLLLFLLYPFIITAVLGLRIGIAFYKFKNEDV